MPLPSVLRDRLRLPVIAAPMFIVSSPNLVIAQCQSGIVGSLPTLNARSPAQLDEWLEQIAAELARWDRDHPEAPAAPLAVNIVVHKTNRRLEADALTVAKHRAPVVITSLGTRPDLNATVQAYGGAVFHDVTSTRFGRKAIEAGADGLVAVCAGAGGHAGHLSPFALIQELRTWFQGPIALSGAIASGGAILAARAMGADLAYVGSAFIATVEGNAAPAYKDMVVASHAEDIVYSNLFTGVHGNYLRASIAAAGLDPDDLPAADATKMDFGSGGNTTVKAWRDIWGCGQGIGAINSIETVRDVVARLSAEYADARRALQGHGHEAQPLV